MDYQNVTPPGGPGMGSQRSLPNSTAVLVLGILSTVLLLWHHRSCLWYHRISIGQ
jgi:hypothetical protein